MFLGIVEDKIAGLNCNLLRNMILVLHFSKMLNFDLH